MARGRRPDSSTPDDPADQPTQVGDGSDLVDPLQVASAGLEDVHQEDGAARISNAFDPEPGTPDPLAVLSRAIDDGLGTNWDEPDPPKRGILGRLGRGRPALVPSASEAASPADPGPAATDESAVTTAQADVQVPPEPAADPSREEPRVTTWAEDFEVASATGEWPAVGFDDEPPPVGGGEPDPATAPGSTESPRRRGGRRRRRKDEPASVQQSVAPAGEEAVPGSEPTPLGGADPTGSPAPVGPEHHRSPDQQPDFGVDEQLLLSEEPAVSQRDDADAERTRLAAVREAAQRNEEDRLAVLEEQEDLRRAEQAEAERLQADRDAALEAERLRVVAEQAEAERLQADRAAAEQAEAERLEQLELARSEAEERRLAAERAEAERIESDRVAAQRAEDDRLEGLRAGAEQAERDRLDGIRVAAAQAERERLEALRAQESRVEQARQEAEAVAAQSAAEQAAAQQAAAEQAAADQAAAKQAEAQRLEQDRLAAEKAEAARAERERQASLVAARSSAADTTPARPSGAAPTRTGSGTTGAAEPVPRFIEFRSTSVLRYLFGALFVVFAVAAVIAIFRAVSDGDRGVVLAAAGLTALAMLSWWALLSWAPPIVSISDGVLEVARGTTTASWDLRAPTTEITFRGRPSSRSWRALLRGPGGKPATISARQVDPAQFVEVVEHYQSVATRTPE